MLSSASYVCDPRPDYPLVITAKRYWISELSSDDPSALTLVLAHGTGYHKEQWEPTIEYLYEYISNDASQTVKVKDVWSIDAPNHGDAAVLNEATLRWGYDICTCNVCRSCHRRYSPTTASRLGRVFASNTHIPRGSRYRCRRGLQQTEPRWHRSLDGCSCTVCLSTLIGHISYTHTFAASSAIRSTLKCRSSHLFLSSRCASRKNQLG